MELTDEKSLYRGAFSTSLSFDMHFALRIDHFTFFLFLHLHHIRAMCIYKSVHVCTFMSLQKSGEQPESMTSKDAAMFPIIASCTLLGLYIFFKVSVCTKQSLNNSVKQKGWVQLPRFHGNAEV